MKLLLVEDEPRLAEMLRRGLVEEGHDAQVCATGAAASARALATPFDAIVLDWGLPDVDGMTLLRRWRERGLRTPVLMLTARGTTREKVQGLRAGADDYLAKPFDFDELVARLEVLQRRGGQREAPLRLGPMQLDLERHALLHEGREQMLTAREFTLFAELARHPGDALPRARLLEAVWGNEFDGGDNVVDVYVGYLRSKLRLLGAQQVSIRTVRGVGYRLLVDEALPPDARR